MPGHPYILFPAVDEFGPVFDQTFLSKTAQFTRECEVTVKGTTITGLELDQNAYLAAMRAFNPDGLLLLRRAGGTKDPYGRLIHVAFNIEFVDSKSSRAAGRDVRLRRRRPPQGRRHPEVRRRHQRLTAREPVVPGTAVRRAACASPGIP